MLKGVFMVLFLYLGKGIVKLVYGSKYSEYEFSNRFLLGISLLGIFLIISGIGIFTKDWILSLAIFCSILIGLIIWGIRARKSND